MQTMTATYSPDDNKIRITSATRLPKDLYLRLKEAGFSWAPKQEQFVAPMWTPERADLAIELCGEIEDENSSLMSRAEGRAERFEGYQENRAADAERAHAYVHSITDGIPLGQPILIGHHSQKHAERDAKRIENGMRKAVKAFETSEYWERRAAGAIAHALYKEDPAVRHRRIKGIEADARKVRANIESAQQHARTWEKVPRFEWDKQTACALFIAGRSSGPFGTSLYHDLKEGRMHGDTAWRRAVASCERYATGRALRWLEHYENRLTYERAMLGESGGIAADRFSFEVGGRVLVGGEWVRILRITRKAGAVLSLSTTRRYVSCIGVEKVEDYEAPSPEQAEAAKAAGKLPPMCNYPGEGFHPMTRAEWDATHNDYKGSRALGEGAPKPSDSYGARPNVSAETRAAASVYTLHRVRSVVHRGTLTAVYLTDAKTAEPVKVGAEPKRRFSIKPKADQDEGERLPAESAASAPVAPVAPPPAVAPFPRLLDPSRPTELMRKCWANQIERGGEPSPIFNIAATEGGQQPPGYSLGWNIVRAHAERAAKATGQPFEIVVVEPEEAPPESATAEPSNHQGDRAAAYALGCKARASGQSYALNPFAYVPGGSNAGAERDAWFNGFNGHADGSVPAAVTPVQAEAPTVQPEAPKPPAVALFPAVERVPRAPRVYADQEPNKFEAMKKALRAGVQVVSAPQLFPTPPELAARMVEEAALFPGCRVLEPSAGTGRIVDAIRADSEASETGCTVVAVEIVHALAQNLRNRYSDARLGELIEVHCRDFLGEPLAVGRFDAVIMNPPFADFQDIAHVTRALDYLQPGGRLVSVLSSGVTFREDRRTRAFRELVAGMGGSFEALPADTFASSGTGVNTVLLVLTKPDAAPGPRVEAPKVEAKPAPELPPGALAGIVPPAEQVAAIVSNAIARRMEWAEEEKLSPYDLRRAAGGLDDCVAGLHADGQPVTAAAYAAAAVRLRELAAEAQSTATA